MKKKLAVLIFVATCITSCTQTARLGAFSISSEVHGADEVAPVVGYGFAPLKGEAGLELAFDVALAKDPGGIDNSTIYFARATYISYFTDVFDGALHYLVGGAAVYEDAANFGTSTLGAVDLGVGLYLGEKINIRTLGTFFVGSENSDYALTASLNYAF